MTTPFARLSPASAVFFAGLLLMQTAIAAPAATALQWPELVPAAFRDQVDNSPPPADESDLGGADMASMQPPSIGGVRQELDGQRVSIPGFVVPLTFDEKQRVRSFFLVPYFGACIHYPPPPPNQTILVTTNQPFELTAVYEPFTITGVLRVANETTELGTADYRIADATLAPYDY